MRRRCRGGVSSSWGPAGQTFTQAKARELATYDQLILLCGHYEGVDYRVEQDLADETISVGDYVLTGGELPAMTVTDAVARMIPGVLGAAAGAADDSFYSSLLEYPQYTKPAVFRGMAVPEVLRNGDHDQNRCLAPGGVASADLGITARSFAALRFVAS